MGLASAITLQTEPQINLFNGYTPKSEKIITLISVQVPLWTEALLVGQ